MAAADSVVYRVGARPQPLPEYAVTDTFLHSKQHAPPYLDAGRVQHRSRARLHFHQNLEKSVQATRFGIATIRIKGARKWSRSTHYEPTYASPASAGRLPPHHGAGVDDRTASLQGLYGRLYMSAPATNIPMTDADANTKLRERRRNKNIT